MKYLKLYENFSEEWDDEDEEEEDDTLDSVFEIINGYGGYDTYIKVNYNELRRYFEVNGILIEGIMVENNKDWGDEQFSEYELYSHIYPRYDKVDEEVILKSLLLMQVEEKRKR